MADQQPTQQSTPAATTTATGLITAQQATNALIRQRVLQAVRAIWQRLPDYRNPGLFVSQIVPIVQAGQQQTAAATAAYLSHLYAEITESPVRMLGVPTDVATGGRHGVDPAEVYARPLHEVWRQLHDLPHQPGAIEQAIQSGLTRAENLAATDLQLAKTHAAQHVLAQQTNVTGYRRVLEGVYSCGLCIVAATRRYHKAELLPIHPGCDCSVEPIVGSSEPVMAAMVRSSTGELVPVAQLADVHERIADTFGRDSTAARQIGDLLTGKGQPLQYKDVLITHDHSELGPVLGVKGQKFTKLDPAPPAHHADAGNGGGGGGKPPAPPGPPEPPAGDPFDAIPPPGPEVTEPDWSKLTQDELLAVSYYTAAKYKAVNEALREGREATAATSVRSAIENIDNALAKYPLPYTVRVARGVAVEAFGVHDVNDLPRLAHQVLRDPAYLSTTIKPLPPDEFMGPDNVVLELAVPAGTPALYVAGESLVPEEQELLVARGRWIQILSASYDASIAQWRVRAVVLARPKQEGGA